MSGLNYLLQTNLYLNLFIGFYLLVLRNETFFRQNRFYLNTSILLSFTIPFINSDWFQELFITQKVRAVFVSNQMMQETIIVDTRNENTVLTVGNILIWVYIGIVIILLIRFFIKLLQLRSSLKPKKGAALSFFNRMVVDKELPESEIIMDHEKVHMKEWHSADIIFMEFAAIINWFNPVIYLYKREIRHIHEFIADEETASMMTSKSDYAMLLFSNTLGVQPNYLINNFFNKSLLKRRIIMLNKNKSQRVGLWKYGFSAPLFAAMLILSAASVATEKVELITEAERLIAPLKGGDDLSTKSIPNIKNEKPDEQTLKNYPTKQKSEPFSALWKHIQKNIKYPASAREKKISGYEIVYFKIQGGKLSEVKIAQGLQSDIDNDVLRTFNLFKESIQAEDNNYAMAIAFQLIGVESKLGQLPSTGKNYFLGSISVSAMGEPQKMERIEVASSISREVTNFASAEVIPEFLDGIKGWGDYLQKALKYPDEARTKNITGRVIMSFIVEKDGSLSEIKVLRGIGGGCDEEAIRVLKTSPNWKPGIQDGRPVRVAYTMPIFFQLPTKTTEGKTN